MTRRTRDEPHRRAALGHGAARPAAFPRGAR